MVVHRKGKAEVKNINCHLVFYTRRGQMSFWARNDMGRKRLLRRALFTRVPNATASQTLTLWTYKKLVPYTHQVRSLCWQSPDKKLLGQDKWEGVQMWIMQWRLYFIRSSLATETKIIRCSTQNTNRAIFSLFHPTPTKLHYRIL